MLECKCGTNYNFYLNGNAQAKNILVVSPQDVDFRKGRVASEGDPVTSAIRIELMKVGLDLYSDFLILPTYYHPEPKKLCYEHAVQSILSASRERSNVLFIGDELFTQLGNIAGIDPKIGTLIPTYEPVLKVNYVIINGNITGNLGDFLIGFKRFSDMVKGG